MNTLNTVVQAIIDDNTFGCTSYIQNDVEQDPVMKIRKAYSARIVSHEGI